MRKAALEALLLLSRSPHGEEILTERNPELANNQLIFPDKATTDQLRQYPNLGAAADREVTAAMQKVTGS